MVVKIIGCQELLIDLFILLGSLFVLSCLKIEPGQFQTSFGFFQFFVFQCFLVIDDSRIGRFLCREDLRYFVGGFSIRFGMISKFHKGQGFFIILFSVENAAQFPVCNDI